MKRRHLLLMALSLILSICMCFGLAACSSCDEDDDAPTKLSTPVVTIDNNGVASWLEVENASGYAYVIADGAETATTKLSVQLTDGQTIKVKAKGDGTSYSDSDFSEVKTYTAPSAQPVQLGAPEVTIGEDGTVTIGTVANATKIVYVIGDGTETEYDSANKPVLEEGQTIKVTAKGDGTNYTDSTVVTKTRPASAPATVMTHAEFVAAAKDSDVLVQGVVTIINGKNVFFSDNDGGYYAYNVAAVPENLAVGMTVKVTGKKDVYYGVNQVKNGGTLEIVDTEVKTVTPVDITDVITNMTSLDKLGAYQNMLVVVKGITIAEFDGTSFKFTLGTVEVTHFVSGKYQVVAQADQEAYKQLFADNAGKTADLTCIVGATTDKNNNNAVIHQLVPASTNPLSNIQTPVTKLTAPTVSVDPTTGIATFTKADGVTYVYKIGENGEETAVPENGEIQLAAGETVYVKAKGDGETTSDSDWSIGKTYTGIDPDTLPALDAPATVTVNADGTFGWTAVEGAVGYAYVIGDGEEHEVNSETLSVTNAPLAAGQTVKVKALGNMTTHKNSAYTTAKYVKKLPDPTVEISLSGEVTITADANATKVVYVVGDDTEKDYNANSKPVLTNGQTIKVTAKGDGESYSDSAVVEETFTETPKPVATEKDVQFDFSEAVTTVSTTAYTNTTAKDVFDAACKNNASYFTDITGTGIDTPVYAGNDKETGFIKFSSGSKSGSLTLTFTKNVTKVVIVAKAFVGTGAGNPVDTPVIIVNGVSSEKLTADITTYTFNIEASNTVTISANRALNETGKTRFFVYSITLTTANSKIDAPKVTISDYGVATWAAVEGTVSGYTYSINDGAAQTATEPFAVQLADGDTIVVTAVSSNADFDNGVSAPAKFELKQTPLAAPTVTISSKGIASWNAVAHATAYVYKIGENGEEHTITVTDPTKTKYTLSDVTIHVGETIYVMSKGDDGTIKVYLDSENWKSDTFSAEPEALHAPVIGIDKDGKVTITPNEQNNEDDVDCIKYYIGADVSDTALAALTDSDWIDVGSAEIQITTSGHYIAVKTLTNDDTGLVLDSAVATAQYKAPSALTAPVKPDVTVEGTTAGKVIVKITKVADASGYAYVKNGADVSTAVKFTNDDKLENGETETTISYVIDLADNSTIAIVALGNSDTFTPAEVGDYSGMHYNSTLGTAETFDIDNDTTYDVKDILPIIVYYGAEKSGNYYNPNTTKAFKVKGIVVSNDAYDATKNYISNNVILKDVNDTAETPTATLTVFRATFEGNVGSTTMAAGEIAGTTVIVTGAPVVYGTSSTLELTSIKDSVDCKITSIEWADNNNRFDKVTSALTVTEHYEEDAVVTLPATLPYGVTITWSIEYYDEEDTTAKAAMVLSGPDENGVYTLTITRQPATDASEAVLVATLHYGSDSKDVEIDLLVDVKTVLKLKPKPVVTIDNDGKATWEPVANVSSSGYAYQIVSSTEEFDPDAEEPSTTTNCFVEDIALGKIIYVKAIGDGTNYSDSDWSEPVTYKIKYNADTTFNFPELYSSVTSNNSGSISGTAHTSDGVSVVFTHGDNSNTLAYYATGSAIRYYGGDTLKISVTGESKISTIVITFGSSNSIKAPDVGTYSNGTWTGLATEVTFGAGARTDIKTITVTYEVDDQTAANSALAAALAKLKNSYTSNFELVTSINGIDVDWSVREQDKTVVNIKTIEGKLTAEVTSPAAATEIQITARVTLNGKEYTSAPQAITINPEGGGKDPQPVEDTFTSSALGYANAELVTEVKCTNGATVTFDKSKGSNAPAYYTSGTNLRVYTNNTIAVDVGEGTLTSIVITCTGSYTGEIKNGDGYTVETSGGTITITFTKDLNTVTFTQTASSQLRITNMTIKYVV